jgi:hypothetical protein
VRVLARVIESSGIPTATVTMMPVLSQKYRSSRVLGVEFPFGHSFGPVGDGAVQRDTLVAALDLLVTATGPDTRVDLDTVWPGDPKQTYKDWQPAEASPIVKHSIEAIRRVRRDAANRKGDHR